VNQVGTDWKYSPMRSTKRILYSLSCNRQTDKRMRPDHVTPCNATVTVVHACVGVAAAGVCDAGHFVVLSQSPEGTHSGGMIVGISIPDMSIDLALDSTSFLMSYCRM
jgi:hypothetical protein